MVPVLNSEPRNRSRITARLWRKGGCYAPRPRPHKNSNSSDFDASDVSVPQPPKLADEDHVLSVAQGLRRGGSIICPKHQLKINQETLDLKSIFRLDFPMRHNFRFSDMARSMDWYEVAVIVGCW